MLGPDGHALGDGQARHAALNDQFSLVTHSIDHLAPPLFGVDVKYARPRLFAERGFGEVRPSYGSVLLPLFEDDGLRMGQIAQRARLSKQTMTTMVRLCERDGLVERERDPNDARAFRIQLTQRAKDFKPVAQEILRELDTKVLATLGERQRSALARALKGVMNL